MRKTILLLCALALLLLGAATALAHPYPCEPCCPIPSDGCIQPGCPYPVYIPVLPVPTATPLPLLDVYVPDVPATGGALLPGVWLLIGGAAVWLAAKKK